MLKEEIGAHLEQKILPFWERLKDETYGGYYGYMDEDMKLDRKADKGCILNSRILWTFATAARELEREDLRPYAEQAFPMPPCVARPLPPPWATPGAQNRRQCSMAFSSPPSNAHIRS